MKGVARESGGAPGASDGCSEGNQEEDITHKLCAQGGTGQPEMVRRPSPHGVGECEGATGDVLLGLNQVEREMQEADEDLQLPPGKNPRDGSPMSSQPMRDGCPRSVQ